MAGSLKFLCQSLSFVILMGGAASLAMAQGASSLSDPTRPPMVPVEPASASSEGAPPPSGLQTVILGKGRKPMAVINGVMVTLGDKIGDATLVKLNESEAVLQGPAGREVLHLLQGLGKKTESSKLNPGEVADRSDDGSRIKTRRHSDSTK